MGAERVSLNGVQVVRRIISVASNVYWLCVDIVEL